MKSELTLSSANIEQVWKALTRQKRSGHPLSDRTAKRMAKAGWLSFHEVDDALCDMDGRLMINWLGRSSDLVDMIGIEKVISYSRKWDYVEEICGSSSISASDVLRLFWWLERLGFPLDAGIFCEKIIKTLPRTKHLIESHIDVLLYRSERYSQPPIKLSVKPADLCAAARTETFITENGILVEIAYSENDHAISLTSTAPNYVVPPKQILVKCEDCGLSYVQGIRSDEERHAKAHADLMEPINPEPSQDWRAAVEHDPEAVWVNSRSPEWMHADMYRRARAFKREFSYDFVQWSEHPHANTDGVAFAFLDDEYRMIGGCRFQIGGGAHGKNRLSWIWLSPDNRRSGNLSRIWPRLREKMGDFDLEPPVSDAMQNFIKKIDRERLSLKRPKGSAC